MGNTSSNDSRLDSFEELMQMNQRALGALYAESEPGPIPEGDSRGKVIVFAGTPWADPASVVAALIWQGKVFDAKKGILINKVFGFKAIKAKVFYGKSWYDSERSIIVDYLGTSLISGLVRDEIRQIGPGMYLGRAYLRTLLGPLFVLNFALDFNH